MYHQPAIPAPHGISPSGVRTWKIGGVVIGIVAGAAPLLLQLSSRRGTPVLGVGIILDIVVNAALWLLLYWAIFGIANAMVKRKNAAQDRRNWEWRAQQYAQWQASQQFAAWQAQQRHPQTQERVYVDPRYAGWPHATPPATHRTNGRTRGF